MKCAACGTTDPGIMEFAIAVAPHRTGEDVKVCEDCFNFSGDVHGCDICDEWALDEVAWCGLCHRGICAPCRGQA